MATQQPHADLYRAGQRLADAAALIAQAKAILADPVRIPGAPDALDFIDDDLEAAAGKASAALAIVEAEILRTEAATA